MTSILEFKNAIKRFYGNFEVILMPLFKFVLAFLYFRWINESMGYMAELNNLLIILILALISSVLPTVVMITVGYILMLMHSYALGIDVAGFFLAIMLIFWIFFLRFSKKQNIVLVFTPLSFSFNVPVLLPIGGGLFGNAISAIPAACGVINYYFVRFLKTQAGTLLGNSDMDIVQRIKMLCDGLLQNWPMWISLVAFVVATLLVHMIRSCSFDYSWKIAILAGGIGYVLVIIAGGIMFNINVVMSSLVVYTLASVILGELLELFVFGGAYSRTERLQYEDDDYYYYVKAIPKATISLSERSIKKINDDYTAPERKTNSDTGAAQGVTDMLDDEPGLVATVEVEDVDFERKLEESLRDL